MQPMTLEPVSSRCLRKLCSLPNTVYHCRLLHGFHLSLDDFAVTFFVTGNGFSTLSVEIYSRARKGISLEINALSALVFLFSIILVVGYYFISREKEEQA